MELIGGPAKVIIEDSSYEPVHGYADSEVFVTQAGR